MRFIKMQGLGNDYVYVNAFEETIDQPEKLAGLVADRHFGIGGDGLILVMRPDENTDAHVRMRMFNADGSEAEMCGNGIRCVCKLAHDDGLTREKPMRVQTGNGVLSLQYTTDVAGKVDQVTVDMGQPILEPEKIPVDPAALDAAGQAQTFSVGIDDGSALEGTMVSMGNPHAVFFVDKLGDQHLRLGPQLETHRAFPRRINVHFVQVHDKGEVTIAHWERGSGPTLACGTGACAVCVAGVLTGRTARKIKAHLPGGDLTLEWRDPGNHVFMTGPATEVFRGEWIPPAAKTRDDG